MTEQPTDNSRPTREQVVRVPAHVVYRAFAHETVLLNLQTGKYHGVNPVGGRMLDALERSGSLAEAAKVIAKEFDRPVADIEQDMTAFCQDLQERDLIEVQDRTDS